MSLLEGGPVDTGAGFGAWAPNLTSRVVDEARIHDIVFTPMSGWRRNRLITLAYGDLAVAMSQALGRTGDTKPTPTWCTYAQWPSDEIGTLMGVSVPGLGPSRARAFAHGNRGVFSDIGQACVAFLETVGVAQPRTLPEAAAAMQQCVERLARMRPPPGRPMRTPADPSGLAGLDLGLDLPAPTDPWSADLVHGLSCYALSLLPDTASVRAQRIWAGNVLLAAHEQKWLQESLAAGLRLTVRRVLHPHLNVKRNVDVRRYRVRPGPRLCLEEWLVHQLTRRRAGFMMNGTWIPVGTEHPGAIPPELQIIETYIDLDELDVCSAEVVVRFQRRRTATCWLSYHQRSGFIADLFLRHHGDTFTSPLDPGEVVEILCDALKIVVPVPPAGPPPPGTDELGPVLDGMRQRADPVADKAVEPIAADIAAAASIGEALAIAYTSPGDEVPGDRFPTITADCATRWADLTSKGLIDAATLRQARDFYNHHIAPMNMALLFSSLPDSYAGDKGVRVLGSVSALGHSPVRRVGQTARWLIHTMDGEFECETSRQRRSIVGVRAFHAIMRAKLPTWPAELGRPINQEDLFGTMLAFVVPVLESFERLGLETPEAMRNAYARTWCALGHLLGVELQLLVIADQAAPRLLGAAEMIERSKVIRWRQQRRNLTGTWLLDELLADVADHFPAGLGGAADTLLRLVGDKRIATMLLAEQRRASLVTHAVEAAVRVLRSPRLDKFTPCLLAWAADGFLAEFNRHDFPDNFTDPTIPPPPEPPSGLPLGCLDEYPDV